VAERNHRIESDDWYSPRDLKLILDISEHVQQQARAAGELQFSQRGDAIVYKGGWVNAWLDGPNSAPTAGSSPQRARAARSTQATTKPASVSPAAFQIEPKGSNPMTSCQDPVATFNERVSSKVEAGASRREAVAAVAREDPDLHTRYLAASNDSASKQKLIQDRHEMNRAG